MKRLLTAISLFLCTYIASAQKAVKLEELSNHIGDSIIVTGKVFGGRYLSKSENAPTFLNVGGAFPNQLLTLVVWGKDRTSFKGAPEETYPGQLVQIAGRVELHRGKPQIVLYHDRQITMGIDSQ
jgi:DNA/RNA endonuclease YhcR with UshA esterase domain